MLAPRRSRSCSRPRASTAPTATPRSGSPSRAGRGRRGACCRRGTSASRATIVIQAWPVVPPPADHLERGLSLVASSVRRDPQNPIVTLKTTSRADYVFARLEARREGADDALFLTLSGHLSEATTANLFLVRRAADGVTELATPSLDCAILPGHDALVAAALGRRRGPPARRGAGSRPDDLGAADEAFMCSSVAGVLPVTRFDGHADRRGRARARGRSAPAPTARRSSPGAEPAQALGGRTRGVPVMLRQALGPRRTPRRAAPGGARASRAASRSSPSVVAEPAVALGLRLPERPARRRRPAGPSSATSSNAQLPSNE